MTNASIFNPIIQSNISVNALINLGFETGDFTGWLGYIGDNNSSLDNLINIQSGIFSIGLDALDTKCLARHTILSNPIGANSCGFSPFATPELGQYVTRLGNTCANY
jgi:hypothetical protein